MRLTCIELPPWARPGCGVLLYMAFMEIMSVLSNFDQKNLLFPPN